MIRSTHRHLWQALLAALSAAGLATGLPAVPTSADAPVADLSCTITVTTDVHPGVTPELRRLATTSHGLTGTAICTGTVDGQPVTGPGRFAIEEQLVGDCTQAAGTGTFQLRIPTAGGTETVAGRFAATVSAAGDIHTGDLSGTAVVVSAVGDCFTTPLTRTTAVLTVHVT
jgi:hypothetical protein